MPIRAKGELFVWDAKPGKNGRSVPLTACAASRADNGGILLNVFGHNGTADQISASISLYEPDEAYQLACKLLALAFEMLERNQK